MPIKKVVVVASGDTERKALRHLCRELRQHGIEIMEPVRTIARRVAERIDFRERLRATISSAWFELSGSSEPPNKFVVLVDADGKTKAEVVASTQEVCNQFSDIPVPCIATAAKWHLEAWVFADEQGLREYLGRDLGAVDPSFPDEIHDPKRHLKNLLGDRFYTADTAAEIARTVNPSIVRVKSPSFADFEQALSNGNLNRERTNE